MRILAVRGANLASLAGPFELDLRNGPLGDAHLFVITGPVGSGKSTLLDALSVALFHQTPRLAEASKARLEDLPADDPRNLLRRGATEGFAEVDFQADDGRSYRARWEVRRARRRAKGTIQKPSCTLHCLETGDSLGGGLNETRAEICRILGLDFNQFQRAVLLAQGEFASFLKADSNQRSALLERMTGTELYGRVSKAAYERARLESEKAAAVQREIDALETVPWEEVVALQGKLEEAEKEANELEALVRVLEREKDWFTREGELAGALDCARDEQAAVFAQAPAIDEQKKELSRTESALSLSAWFSAVDELKDQAEALSAGLETHRNEAGQARENRDHAEQAVVLARNSAQAAEALRQEKEPLIEEALRLDEQLRLAEEALTAAEKRHREANQRNVQAEENLRASRDLLSGLQKTARDLEEFKKANSARAPLFTEQKHWLEQILQYERLKEEEAKSRQSLDELARTIDDLRRKEEGVSSELATENGEIERLEAGSASLEAEIAALDPDQLVRFEQETRNRQDEAAALEKNNSDLKALLNEAHRILAERGDAAEDAAETRRLAAEIDSRLPALEAAAVEAERAWRTALASRKPNIEQLRSELRPGTPCPVCGALDHPWASNEAPLLDELVEKSAKRREELSREIAVLQGRRVQQDARLEHLQRTISRADERLDVLAPEREKLRAVISEGAKRLGLPDPAAAAQVLSAARSQLETIGRQLRLARDKEAVLRSTVQQLRSRKRIFEKHSALHSRLKTDLSVARSRHESGTSQLKVTTETRERLRSRISSAFSCLSGLVGPVSKRRHYPLLDEDPAALRRMFGSLADDWKKKLEQLEEARRQISSVEAQVEYRERESREAAAECVQAETALLARKREANDLAARRALLFDGRAVTEVRQELEGTVQAARAQERAAERNLEAAKAELARLETTIESQSDQLETSSEKLDARRRALDKQLQSLSFTEEEARTLASRGEDWCRQTRAAISEYEQQRVRVRERVEERERQLAEHQRNRPERSAADVERLISETLERRKALDRLQAELGARIIHSRTVKDKIKALSDQLVVLEEQGRVWLQLGEVIGSADGKAFRNFAQTYTLELLLEHANRHLADLKPRYRLEPFCGDSHDPLGIVVVDQDMGDERRPVNTLSGGETFLVSLALALGLSSLQSHRVRLGSLFIDEGFGALDTAALQTALAALEALQLQDRQIGIISHIEGLSEHFPAEVQVLPLGAGTSRVEVVGRPQG
ncbi:MAG: AAA family ATPase [Acidobacteriota bacterium]